MKILITGGAGFIGSHVCEKYINENHNVYVLDNFSTGYKENIPFVKKENIIEVNIEDKDAVESLLVEKKFDVIVHLAAVVSVVETIQEPYYSHCINTNSTLNLLEIIRKNNLNVKKFIFASSAAVYGDNKNLPNSEHNMINPKSPYAIQKYTSEQYCKIYNEVYNIPSYGLRFFNVFGPRQDPRSPYSGVISILNSAFLNKTQFTFFGDGTQTRDFIYVKDVVKAIDLIIKKKELNEFVFNVGTGKEYSINEVKDIFEQVYGYKIKYRYEEFKTGDIENSYADIKKIKKYGFEYQYSLKDGLKTYINHTKF